MKVFANLASSRVLEAASTTRSPLIEPLRPPTAPVAKSVTAVAPGMPGAVGVETTAPPPKVDPPKNIRGTLQPAPKLHSDPYRATAQQPFVNSLGMKFAPVVIRGGDTDGRDLLFCIHETRRADYEQYAKANGAVTVGLLGFGGGKMRR